MTLLAPAWLLLALLAGPLLLLHAGRRRRVEVPSTRIWAQIEHVASRSPRITWPRLTPLLLVQIAVILFAALALAQPRVTALGAAPPGHAVFLVDISGAMRATDLAPSRLDAAREEIRRRAAAVTASGGMVSVIAVGGQPSLVAARQDRDASIEAALLRLRPGDGAADWQGALGLAGRLLLPQDDAGLFLVGWGADLEAARDTAAARFGPRVAALSLGAPDTANASLAGRISPTPAPDRWRIEGTVTIAGPGPAPDRVALHFGRMDAEGELPWGTLDLREVTADADAATRTLRFSGEATLPGAGRLALSIAADAGPHDNRLHFVIQSPPPPLRVLLLGPAPADLLRALSAVGEIRLARAESLPPDDAAFDLAIVNDVTVKRRPATNTLWIARGRIEGEVIGENLSQGVVTGWRGDHPLSRDAGWADIGTVQFFVAPELEGAQVLAAAAGHPLAQARTTAAGREVRLSLDPARSGWAAQPGYPAFVAALVDWTGARPGQALAPACTAGDACILPARDISASVVGPDGAGLRAGITTEVHASLPAGAETFLPAIAGFHRVEHAGSTRWIAVNPPPGATADLRNLPLNPIPAEDWTVAPLLRWWLLLGVFFLLLLEAWLAGRGAERFLHVASLRRSAPRSGRRRSLLVLRTAALGLVAAALVAAPMPWRDAGFELVTVAEPSVAVPDALRDRMARQLVQAGPSPELLPQPAGQVRSGQTEPEPVDHAAALGLALGLLPQDRVGRVLLLAEGAWTIGGAGTALAEFRSRGVAIDVVAAIPAQLPGDVTVEAVELPRSVHRGESFVVNALIRSPEEGVSAQLRLYQDKEVVTVEEVLLGAGLNRVEAVATAGMAGTLLVEVAVDVQGDPEPRNNRNGAVVVVSEAPSVLILAPVAEDGEQFAAALELQGFAPTVLRPVRAPVTLEGWLRHDLVVLMNMPALDMTIAQQEQLQQAVARNGLGLIILGGENSFGPGGYFETPLEELSPLSSEVPHDAPVASLVFVLDRSGSMQTRITRTRDETRMDVAKSAIINAVEFLNEESRVGIVAFDDQAYTILPLLERRDISVITAALAPLSPGGGTALMPGLVEAIPMLESSDATVKHMIVMTDGLIEAADFSGIVKRATDDGISISAIAVGSPAISDRLEAVALLGGGHFYSTRDFRSLPSIMAQETFRMSAAPFTEATSPAIWVDRTAAFLADLPGQMPPVASHVATTIKPDATLHMVARDPEGSLQPLLASWRYGNGQVVAFAAHGAGHGSRYWMDRADYPRFWAQVARHALASGLGPGLHLSAVRQGDAAEVTATLVDDAGQPVSGAPVTATLGDADPVALKETAPGVYRVQFALAPPADLALQVVAGDLAEETRLHAAYPARLSPARADPAALAALAAVTGGKLVVDPAALEWPQVWVFEPAWMPWALAALGLFLTDMAVRYGGDWRMFRLRPPEPYRGRTYQPKKLG